MLDAIRKFFDEKLNSEDEKDGEHALRLATAALLFEVMLSDDESTPEELAAFRRVLSERFELADAEIDELLRLAEAETRDASDYHQFTQLVNFGYSMREKSGVIEHLWQIAYADGHADRHEEYLIRKVSDLIGVEQHEFIAAKQRARDKA